MYPKLSGIGRVGLAVMAPLVFAACHQASLELSSHDFSSTVGVRVIATIQVVNTSGMDAELGEVSSAALGLTAPFSHVGGSCVTGGIVPKDRGACTLQIAFLPTVATSYSQTIELEYSSGGARLQTAVGQLTGIGLAGNCYEHGCAEGQVCTQLTSSLPETGTCVSVPDPPPGCMAPCLWEAQKKCLPVLGACTSDLTLLSTRDSIKTRCNLSTGWSIQELWQTNSPVRVAHRKNGVTCYETEISVVSDVNGTVGQQAVRDGTRPIAVVAFDLNTGTSVLWCGPYTSVLGLDPAQSYHGFSSPECTTWRQTYLDWTTCRSETFGSCAGF